MNRPERRIPFLVFSGSIVQHTIPPGMERPEPYGYPLKEANFFAANDDLPNWDRFIGWHDWAVILNTQVGRVFHDARACLERWHPVSQHPDRTSDLSFSEALIAGLPQFFLCVWELELNGWLRLIREDPVSRVLLDVREGRPVGNYRCAINAAFVEAASLARVLGEHPALREEMADLRERHSRHHAAHPWCWLRYFWERQQAYDILCMLEGELRRWQGSVIVTPEQLRCERWHKAARRRFLNLMQSEDSPDCMQGNAIHARSRLGFDWSIQVPESVDVEDLARCIIRCLNDYNHDVIVQELVNEIEYVSNWINRVEAEHQQRMLDEMQDDFDDEWQADQEKVTDPDERSPWFDCEPDSDSKYKYGPLSGTLKQLTKWMAGPSQPTLKSNNGKSNWYIRKLMGRHFSVWFDSQRKFAEANQRHLADERYESKTNETK